MPRSIGIRGAGVAGLSLASALLQEIPEVSIFLCDLRTRLPHPERTFCFFNDGVPTIPVAPDHTWSSVSFRSHEFVRTVRCEGSPYTLIRGDRFFSGMLSHLERLGVEFTWGCQSINVEDNALIVDGERREFDLVVDAAFQREDAEPILWQSFGGIWVDAEEDLFDPRQALLMDLGGSTHDTPVSFVYVLPTSRRTALIEHTTFSRVRYPVERHLEECSRWIASNRLSGTTIRETEHGAIPMGLPVLPPNRIRIGSGAGALRGSTGYAFASIQRQVHGLAAEIARSLSSGMPAPSRAPRAYPAWMEFGDTLFLKTLARVPEQGSVLMERLLERAPERELISFLSGQAGIWSALRVMACLPKGTMMRSLCPVSMKAAVF